MSKNVSFSKVKLPLHFHSNFVINHFTFLKEPKWTQKACGPLAFSNNTIVCTYNYRPTH